jgi:hypothetical protein
MKNPVTQLIGGHAVRLTLIVFALLVTITSARPVAAQSTDLDHPTPMTTNEVKGRYPKGKGASYFFSFEGGPGEVRIMLDFLPDQNFASISGQLTDAYGRPFASLDPASPGLDLSEGTELHYFANEKGQRLIGRYAIKQRQKLVVRISISGDDIAGGRYKVRVEGDGVTFNDSGSAGVNSAGTVTSTNNPAINNPPASNRPSCLPTTGKLRLVMDDGTVQEINLGRVREVSVKP